MRSWSISAPVLVCMTFKRIASLLSPRPSRESLTIRLPTRMIASPVLLMMSCLDLPLSFRSTSSTMPRMICLVLSLDASFSNIASILLQASQACVFCIVRSAQACLVDALKLSIFLMQLIDLLDLFFIQPFGVLQLHDGVGFN